MILFGQMDRRARPAFWRFPKQKQCISIARKIKPLISKKTKMAQRVAAFFIEKRSKTLRVSFLSDRFRSLMIDHCKYQEEQRHNDDRHDGCMCNMRGAVDEIFVTQHLLHPVPNKARDQIVVKERHSKQRHSEYQLSQCIGCLFADKLFFNSTSNTIIIGSTNIALMLSPFKKLNTKPPTSAVMAIV